MSTVKGVETSTKYFEKALELRLKYDPMNALHRAGINPQDDNHDMDRIRHALTAGYGARTCMHCAHTGHDERTLSWIEVCFKSDDFSVTDCPEHRCWDFKDECKGHMLYKPLPGMSTKLSTGILKIFG